MDEMVEGLDGVEVIMDDVIIVGEKQHTTNDYRTFWKGHQKRV